MSPAGEIGRRDQGCLWAVERDCAFSAPKLSGEGLAVTWAAAAQCSWSQRASLLGERMGRSWASWYAAGHSSIPK